MYPLCLKNIETLPIELSDIIFEYMPSWVKVWLTCGLYTMYHHCIRDMIPSNLYDSYVRMLIRKKYSNTFAWVLHENYIDWFTRSGKRYYYDKKGYSRYISFLEKYCITFNSTKCRNELRKITCRIK
jgi:hypothetical protein